MAEPFATVDDVHDLRPLSGSERGLAQTLLRYASALMRRQVPSLDARIADGTLDPLLPQLVAVQMVVRVLRNPDGIRQETVGPSSITYDTTQAVGQLMLTAADLATLSPPGTGFALGTRRLGAGLATARDARRGEAAARREHRRGAW